MAKSENGAAGGKPEPGKGGGMSAFAKRLAWAYGVVAVALGAFGGAYTAAIPFAKTAGGLAVAAVVGTVVLVATIAALAPLAGSIGRALHGPATWMAIVGVTALAAGIGIGHLFSSSAPRALPHSHSEPPPPPSTSGAGAASGTASACPKQLTITSPKNNAAIVGHVGVDIDIEACGLIPGETGWVFDYSVDDGTFGLDGGGPVVTADGSTPFNDSPVGDKGDVDEDVKLTVVLADSACSTALGKMDLDNDTPTALPSSCVIEDQVLVVETY